MTLFIIYSKLNRMQRELAHLFFFLFLSLLIPLISTKVLRSYITIVAHNSCIGYFLIYYATIVSYMIHIY
jgi:hypothetical protein